MDISSLNIRETLFLQGMLTHGKKQKAALEAGCPPGSAHVEATRMIKKDKIRTILDNAKIEIIEEAIENAKVDATWVLEQLTALTEVSINDFMLIDEKGKPYYDFSTATPEQMACIEGLEVSPGEWGTKIKLKLPNKRHVLETIGKHTTVEAFKERVEHLGNVVFHFDKEDEDA